MPRSHPIYPDVDDLRFGESGSASAAWLCSPSVHAHRLGSGVSNGRTCDRFLGLVLETSQAVEGLDRKLIWFNRRRGT